MKKLVLFIAVALIASGIYAQGEMEVKWTQKVTVGDYDVAKTFNTGGETYTFFYDSKTGNTRVFVLNNGKIDPNRPTYLKKDHPNWEGFVFFNLDDDAYLFKYKKDGNVKFFKMNKDGSIGDMVGQKKWSTGWTDFDYLDGHILMMNPGQGKAAIFKPVLDGDKIDAKWTQKPAVGDYKTLKTFSSGGKKYVFFYKESSGATRILEFVNGKVDPNRPAYLKKDHAGWTGFVFYTMNKESYLFKFKKDGNIKFFQMKDDGSFGDMLGKRKWSTGWTDFDYANGHIIMMNPGQKKAAIFKPVL